LEAKSATRTRVAWAVVAILSNTILALVFKSREPSNREAFAPAPIHPLWNVLFRPDQRTMIVPGDSGLVMWQGLTSRKVSVADYLSGEYRSEATVAQTAAQKSLIDLANRRYTSIVDLDVVKALSHIADARWSALEVRYARDVRPNDVKEGTVVLVGAAAANPWVELFEPNMNFVFQILLFVGIPCSTGRRSEANLQSGIQTTTMYNTASMGSWHSSRT
jgi:hypothetical protein